MWFGASSFEQFINVIKGGDYEGKDVVGQDIANELKLAQFVDGKSTTNTIKRIKNSETSN